MKMEETKQPKTLNLHTNAHAIRGRPTSKDVQSVQRNFRNGPVHESVYSSHSKVLTSSYELTNSTNITENFNRLDKTTTTDLKTDCMYAESKKSDAPEVKNLKKPTTLQDHSMVNKKAAILNKSSQVTRLQFIFLNQYFKIFIAVSTVWILMFVFMLFIIYENGFSKVFIIFFVTIQVITLIVLLCTWTALYILHSFSECLDECHILEKTNNFCYVNICNDAVVSIKVQKCRSRYAKYLYYNCSRVVCECHGNKRDREPSRIPQKKLRSLSQKNRNIQRYVWHRVFKTVPKSSQVHSYISGIRKRQRWKNSDRKYMTFVYRMRKKGYVRINRDFVLHSASKHHMKFQKWLNFLSCNSLHNGFKGPLVT